MMDLQEVSKQAIEVTKTAVQFIRDQSGKFSEKEVIHKGFNDLVSYVDKTSEQIIVDGLRKVIPGCGFITEEETATSSNEEYVWIIDPLDGTTNFVHGIPCYCVSIALMQNRKLVLGIIHEVNLDECFYSWQGGSAYLNGKIIHVSTKEKLADGLIATGFPYTNFSRMKEYMQVFDFCMKNTRGLRRLGSAAVDLAYVACGRFESFYEYGLNSWDVAAGAFLVAQAGGKVSDFKGGDNYVFGKEIIASNNFVHEEFVAQIRKEFGNN